MPTFLFDTCTDTAGTLIDAHTANTGGTWIKNTEQPGTGVISDANRMRSTSTTIGMYYCPATPATADYATQADFVPVGSPASDNYMGIWVRFTTGAVRTGYLLAYARALSRWELVRHNAGSFTILATYSATLTASTTVRLTVTGTGTTVTCIANIGGTDRIIFNDTSGSRITSVNKAGVFFNGTSSNTNGDHLDNIAASEVPALAVATNDASIFYSPANWFLSGSTYAQTNCCGAYIKTNFTGTSVGLTIDSSILGTGTIKVRSVVDDRPAYDVTVSSTVTSIIPAICLTDTTHTLQVWVVSDSAVELWNPAATNDNFLRITSVNVDTGKAISTPTLRTKRAIIYGDSITRGVWNITTGQYFSGSDATTTWAVACADALDAEYGVIGFGGQGWTIAGQASIPSFTNAWNLHFVGQSRLTTGALPTVDYLIINHGANDGLNSVSNATVQAAVSALLPSLRAASTGSKMLVVIPFGQYSVTGITNGFNDYQTATPDTNCKLIDLTTAVSKGIDNTALSWKATDLVHPTTTYGERLGADTGGRIERAFASGGAYFSTTGRVIG